MDVVVVSLTRSSFPLRLWVWVFFRISLGRDIAMLCDSVGGVLVSIEELCLGFSLSYKWIVPVDRFL